MATREYPFGLTCEIPFYEAYSLQPVQEMYINISDIPQELALKLLCWCKENNNYVRVDLLVPDSASSQYKFYTKDCSEQYRFTFYDGLIYKEFCERFKELYDKFYKEEPEQTSHSCAPKTEINKEESKMTQKRDSKGRFVKADFVGRLIEVEKDCFVMSIDALFDYLMRMGKEIAWDTYNHDVIKNFIERLGSLIIQGDYGICMYEAEELLKRRFLTPSFIKVATENKKVVLTFGIPASNWMTCDNEEEIIIFKLRYKDGKRVYES